MLGREEAEAASRAILSGWVTQGPEVAAFEREFARFVGSEHACAVSSGTTALHLALLAVDVKPGDEVITVSHSFIATANAIRYCGATPVFADIEPETFNVDARQIERLINPRTRAILCVHQMGMPCAMADILPIARRHGLALVEDAACAVGSEILWEGRWERIGKPHGDIACFSFHPRKLLTTGDGGMLTTGSAEWDGKFRLSRQHGMSVPDSMRHASGRVIYEDYVDLGYNYRLTDIQAAVGREQLKRLPEQIEKRRALVERYRRLLGEIPGLRLPEEPAWARSNWQSFCVRLPEHANQRMVMQFLLDAGIAARRGVMCAHREPAYPLDTWSCGPEHLRCDCGPGRCNRLVHSERAQDTSVILPLFTQLTEAQQDRVAVKLREACEPSGAR
jgi:dTDP-4-amino-4,6-dideoxygalactose transaminase